MPKTYKVEILGETYRVRGASRNELAQALSFSEQSDLEDYLTQTCLIEPKVNINECLAGIPVTLSEAILKYSGMDEEGAKLLQEEAATWITSTTGKMEALMVSQMGLSLEDIGNLDPPDYFKCSSAAQLLASMSGIDLEKFMKFNPYVNSNITKPHSGGKKNLPPQLLN